MVELLQLLAQVGAAVGGDWSRLVRAVKLTGFVASAPGFFDQPKVVNGASELIAEVLGEAGRHARSAVGVAAAIAAANPTARSGSSSDGPTSVISS